LLLLLPSYRRRRERDLREELEANLSLALADAAESGRSERAARRDFGNLTRAQEEARAFWLPAWDAAWHDLRFAARTLLRNPAFSLVAILSLAFGAGAATAVFSVVNGVLLKPLSYRDPGKLVFIREVVPPLAHIYPTLPVNFQHFRFWRQHARSFTSLSAVMSSTVTMRVGAEAETIGAAAVTANLFELLGVPPQLGRSFQNAEEEPGSGSVAVITDGLWRRRFAASPSILGQKILLGDTAHSVIGVLPPHFRFPKKDDLGTLAGLSERTDIFFPIQQANPGWGGDYDYIVFGRLRPGVTAAAGLAELDLLESRIAAGHKLNYGLRVRMAPLQQAIASPVRVSLTVLLAAVLLLVLMVCVNLANLLLARGSARGREFSMRVALGASRSRLLISALYETVILSTLGGALGVFAAHVAIGAFVRSAPIGLPRLDEVAIDGRVLAFALGLSLLCGVLFGLIPALRVACADTQSALRSESVTISGNRRALHLRQWLVATEVTLGTVLLFIAALLVTSLWNVLHVEKGFTAQHALQVSIALPSDIEAAQRVALLERIADRLRAAPGVAAVAVASRAPLTGESNVNTVELGGGDAGALDAATRRLVMVNVRFVGQDYFTALGIPLIQGRPIEAADRDRNVALVSERLAAKLWPGQNPLGKVLSSGSGVTKAAVVGVVADVHTTRLERDPTLMVYAPYWRNPRQAASLMIRSATDAAAVSAGVREALRSIDPGIPPPKIRSMEQIVAESLSQRRFQMTMSVAFAGSALLIAALGIYGVVAYGAALRRREIGIRIALGASASHVRRHILRQGLQPVAAGMISGVLIALAAGRLIRSLLYGVEVTDGLILGVVAGSLTLVATLACLGPARSASALDPAKVLRCE
jgi:putative ABC transport system permease protein